MAMDLGAIKNKKMSVEDSTNGVRNHGNLHPRNWCKLVWIWFTLGADAACIERFGLEAV